MSIEKQIEKANRFNFGKPMFFIFVFIIMIVISGCNIESQDKAEKANEGRGSVDNPIPANKSAIFDNFDITLSRISFPATQQVKSMNMFNADPATGTDYLLMWVKVDCKKEGSKTCNSRDFNLYIYDSKGTEWPEENGLVINTSLGDNEAIGSNSFEGWTVFKFPSGDTVQRVKVTSSGGVELNLEPPK
jgi:hypothetical protein